MRTAFPNDLGEPIVVSLAAAIEMNKQYLSDIDGLIGDGDHGVNMNKGFTLCRDQLRTSPGDFTHALSVLSQILMSRIGGSMGPLYGMFFRAWANSSHGAAQVDSAVFGRMLHTARTAIEAISPAKPGDKTLMDVLVPADEAYQSAFSKGADFRVCLQAMCEAAERGRDSTRDMVAKLGRSSRLGERSRGVLDAGAASCCLILQTTARSMAELLD